MNNDLLRFGQYVILSQALMFSGILAWEKLAINVPPPAFKVSAPLNAEKCEADCGLPPAQFQKARTVIVEFTEGEDVVRRCGRVGTGTIACADGNRIIAENPCSVMARTHELTGPNATKEAFIIEKDAYAQFYKGDDWTYRIAAKNVWTRDTEFLWGFAHTMCHELGHVNGWPGDHWHMKELP